MEILCHALYCYLLVTLGTLNLNQGRIVFQGGRFDCSLTLCSDLNNFQQWKQTSSLKYFITTIIHECINMSCLPGYAGNTNLVIVEFRERAERTCVIPSCEHSIKKLLAMHM